MNAPQSVVDKSARSVLNLYSLSHIEAILGRSRLELRDLAANALGYYQPFPLRKKERPFARYTKPSKRRLIDNPVGPV